MNRSFVNFGKIAFVLIIALVGSLAPAAAQEPPLSFPELAKAVQTKVMALKSAPDGANSPFMFGHFLKPPPPPKTEEEAQQAEAPVVLPPEIKCQGVMQMGGGLMVVTNSGTYKRGDKVKEGAQITNITQDTVTFLYRGKQFKLPAR